MESHHWVFISICTFSSDHSIRLANNDNSTRSHIYVVPPVNIYLLYVIPFPCSAWVPKALSILWTALTFEKDQICNWEVGDEIDSEKKQRVFYFLEIFEVTNLI